MLIYLASYPRSGNRWSQDLIRYSFERSAFRIYSIYDKSHVDELYVRFGQGLTQRYDADGRSLLSTVLRKRIAAAPDIVILKTHELPYPAFADGEKVLHVVRHPGAALWSYLHFLRDIEHRSVDLNNLILGVHAPGSWSGHTKAWMEAGNALSTRYLRYSYEAMHGDITAVRDAVGRLLGLAPQSDISALPALEESRKRFPLLVRSGSIDEWQAHFTSLQRRMLIESHGEVMRELGYATNVPRSASESDAALSTTESDAIHASDRSIRNSSQSFLQRMLGHRYRRYELAKYRVSRKLQRLRWSTRTALGLTRTSPLVLHITHQKAGSQWIAEILKGSVAENRFVPALPNVMHFTAKNLKPGAVLPALYLTRDQVENMTTEYAGPIRRVVVIRDLRDTLVSLYFSMRYSHEEKHIGNIRETLQKMNISDGLRWLMQTELPKIADIQKSWVAAGSRLLMRYEDIIVNEFTAFDAMMKFCGIQMNRQRQRYLIADNSFAMSSGRPRGKENIMSHQRRGIAGDWRNHFTDELKSDFKMLYGEVLIATGYETDLSW